MNINKNTYTFKNYRHKKENHSNCLKIIYREGLQFRRKHATSSKDDHTLYLLRIYTDTELFQRSSILT